MGVGAAVVSPPTVTVLPALGVSLALGVQVGALVRVGDCDPGRTVADGKGSVIVGDDVAVRKEVGNGSGGNGFRNVLGLVKRV